MSEISLGKLLAAAGRRMTGDLAERLLTHPGELGADREEIIREFLRAYLPKRFEISTGFAFDASGRLSDQLDIIIADSLVCSRFETSGGKRIYPCEGIVAVGQVRSSLTSVAKLQEALTNLESVKILDRSARGRAMDRYREEAINHETDHLHQIFTFLFIAGRSLAADTVS